MCYFLDLFLSLIKAGFNEEIEKSKVVKSMGISVFVGEDSSMLDSFTQC